MTQQLNFDMGEDEGAGGGGGGEEGGLSPLKYAVETWFCVSGQVLTGVTKNSGAVCMSEQR